MLPILVLVTWLSLCSGWFTSQLGFMASNNLSFKLDTSCKNDMRTMILTTLICLQRFSRISILQSLAHRMSFVFDLTSIQELQSWARKHCTKSRLIFLSGASQDETRPWKAKLKNLNIFLGVNLLCSPRISPKTTQSMQQGFKHFKRRTRIYNQIYIT